MVENVEQVKNQSLRYPSRPGSIDPRALQTNVFPYDAFQFDDPNTVADPKVRLVEPFAFEVGEIVASEISGAVTVEGNTVLQLTDEQVIEAAGVEGLSKVWYTVVGDGVYVKDRELAATATKVSDKDLRNLFVTGDQRVGGISVGDSQGVWIDGVRYITDAVVNVAFEDWQNVYCVLNEDHKIYKYNITAGTSALVINEAVQWVSRGCDGNIVYQTVNGVYEYDGAISTQLLTDFYYKGQYNNGVLILHAFDAKVYVYDGTLVDTGVVAYFVNYCDGLLYIEPSSLNLYIQLENALIEGIKVEGQNITGNFIGSCDTGSFTIVALDLDEMKKVFVGDIISGGGFTNAEVEFKGGNYIRLSAQATADQVNYSFNLTGSRLTLNANQVIIPGTVTANEIEAKTITANEIAAGTITVGEIADGAIEQDKLQAGVSPNVSIKSSNFLSGSAGWAIFDDGDAEFNNITARGDLEADSFSNEGYALTFHAGTTNVSATSYVTLEVLTTDDIVTIQGGLTSKLTSITTDTPAWDYTESGQCYISYPGITATGVTRWVIGAKESGGVELGLYIDTNTNTFEVRLYNPGPIVLSANYFYSKFKKTL